MSSMIQNILGVEWKWQRCVTWLITGWSRSAHVTWVLWDVILQTNSSNHSHIFKIWPHPHYPHLPLPVFLFLLAMILTLLVTHILQSFHPHLQAGGRLCHCVHTSLSLNGHLWNLVSLSIWIRFHNKEFGDRCICNSHIYSMMLGFLFRKQAKSFGLDSWSHPLNLKPMVPTFKLSPNHPQMHIPS